ncbi:MAG: putative membrane protein [uncultured Rubellimicrobium sp.]|uniref:Putative membrane protein n=1 Tax=uncultured Rubellimicrobium sp. TaxID=543078 RepID=A0A6J4NPV8_9RHOB|nr:MAG: putative membrane protein [uncultured Rubellimicrobium sp.]
MRPLPLLVLLFTLAFIASGYLIPFDGYDGTQVPIPQVDPPIQPAGWAFSVWGVIYGWLLVSAVFGILKRADDPQWDRARVPLLLSLVLGTPWVAIANVSAVWATVVIFGMLASAVWALLRAPARDRWWLQAPVALYAGWLTAAAFVSLGSTMAGWGIGPGSLGWAFIGIPLALLTAVAVLVAKPQTPEYAVTVCWGLFGIAMKNGADLPGVTALAVAGILSLAVVAWAGRRRVAPARPV